MEQKRHQAGRHVNMSSREGSRREGLSRRKAVCERQGAADGTEPRREDGEASSKRGASSRDDLNSDSFRVFDVKSGVQVLFRTSPALS